MASSASKTHLSGGIGFIGMDLGSRPNFSIIAVCVGPTTSTVTCIPSGENSKFKASPRVRTKGLAGALVCKIRHASRGSHGAHKKEASTLSLG